MTHRFIAGVFAVAAAGVSVLFAAGVQQPPAGRGVQAPRTARETAPVNLTGLWVSVVTEDWRWRMRTPPKGDYTSLPLTEAAIKVADAWDPARDAAAGEQCRPYGAAAIMRVPGRIRIGWHDDVTLKVETEAGTQTRLFSFAGAQAAAEPINDAGLVPKVAASEPDLTSAASRTESSDDLGSVVLLDSDERDFTSTASVTV